MNARKLLPVLALVMAVGCGSSTGDSTTGSAETTPTAESTPRVVTDPDCSAAAKAVTTPLGEVDLLGDGASGAVVQTPASGACANSLVVTTASGPVAVALKPNRPPMTSAKPVTLPGLDGQGLVTREEHPMGGYQVRLFAVVEGTLAELTNADGNPVVPFVATDTPPNPISVDCTDDGLVLRQAVAHTPAGVMFAWDVEETAYQLDGTAYAAAAPTEVADNLTEKKLAQDYPALVKNEFFTHC